MMCTQNNLKISEAERCKNFVHFINITSMSCNEICNVRTHGIRAKMNYETYKHVKTTDNACQS